MGLSSFTFRQEALEDATYCENSELKARCGRLRSFKIIETGI